MKQDELLNLLKNYYHLLPFQTKVDASRFAEYIGYTYSSKQTKAIQIELLNCKLVFYKKRIGVIEIYG